jgi:VWFA-related protein
MRRFAVGGLVVLFVVAGLVAQKKKPQDDAPHSPRLVKLNVSAMDGSGGRPGDLTEGDFQVFDNGKPQKIVSFRKNDTKVQPLKPLAPHEFSNKTAAAVPNATLILFDLLNDRLGVKGYAWSEITKTLQGLEASDHLYLYLLSSDARFYPVHPLPDEDVAAAKADDGSWTRDVKPMLDDAMNKAARVRPIDMTDVNVRVRTTFGSLAAISSRLAAIPGRKNLIWITRGIPISIGPRESYTGTFEDFSGVVQSFAASLERSEIAVYPVDLSPPGMDPVADASTGRGGVPSAAAGLGSADTLQQFADITGGKAYLNQDVKGAIVQATGDARMSYQLAYYPTPQAFDGKYHKIKVVCTRKGIRVNSKNGYYASNDLLISRTQQEAVLDTAITSQFDASQIGLNVVVTPSKKFYSSVHFEMAIDPGTAVEPDGGKFLITLMDLHADGKNGVSPSVALDYKPGAGPIPFTQERTVDGTVSKVRIIVMDSKTNAVGSITIPITPADLSPNKL